MHRRTLTSIITITIMSSITLHVRLPSIIMLLLLSRSAATHRQTSDSS